MGVDQRGVTISPHRFEAESRLMFLSSSATVVIPTKAALASGRKGLWEGIAARETPRAPSATRVLVSGRTLICYLCPARVASRIRRLRRQRRLESSPYYAVLQGIKGGHKAIPRILARLQREEYIQYENISFEGLDGKMVVY